MARQGRLDLSQALALAGHALYGFDVSPIRLHGEHKAGARRSSIHKHRASAADAMLATQMRSRQSQVLAQEIAKMNASVDFALENLAIHMKANTGEFRHARLLPPVPRPCAAPV